MSIALGIDVECIEHTPAYRSLDSPDPIDVDVPAVLDELLDLFKEYDATGTFFVVSEFATDHPEVVRRIVDRGHEVASHTRTHQSVPDVDDDRQRVEIDGSKSDLESVIECPVVGFRAPTCRIDDRVYRRLLESGYEYSSSVMPGLPVPGFYSNEYEFTTPVVISNGERNLVEFPISVQPLVRLPISGAWMRVLGRQYALKSVQQLLDRGTDVVTYSHPWEFVALQDTSLPIRNRIRTGKWFAETYEQLLQFDATYCTVSDLVDRSVPAGRYELSNT